MPVWFSDFTLVLPDRVIERGALAVADGRILDIAERPVPKADVEGRGMLLIPGLVDIHGDMIERMVEPRPNVRMPMALGLGDLDRLLAAAGITTAYAAVSFSPASAYGHLRSYPHTSAMIRALKAAANDLLVDHRIHARFEVTFPHARDVVEALVAEGLVDLLSLNDHTPGQGQYRDLERHVATVAKTRNLTEAEARAEIAQRIAIRTHPAEVMDATISAIVALCAEKGVPVASHDDDTEAKVALMAGYGARISEFPVTLEAAAHARALGLAIAMGAPNALRGGSYSGNLSARDAHAAGLLDMLASDYHPSAMLPAALELDGGRDLPGAIRLVTANPAAVMGLTDRGRLAPGLRADLVIAEPGSPARVRAALRAGRIVYSDGWIEAGLPARAC